MPDSSNPSDVIERANVEFGPFGWSYSIEDLPEVAPLYRRKEADVSGMLLTCRVSVEIAPTRWDGSNRVWICREAMGTATAESERPDVMASAMQDAVNDGIARALTSFMDGMDQLERARPMGFFGRKKAPFVPRRK